MLTYICIAFGLYCGTTTSQMVIPRDEPTILQTQEIYLERLSMCESSGSTTIRIIDTNNQYSTGKLQFQNKTFLEQGKLYNLIPRETLKAEPLIYDGELQKKIARKMLENHGEGHWLNCTNKIGDYPH